MTNNVLKLCEVCKERPVTTKWKNKQKKILSVCYHCLKILKGAIKE